MRTPLKTVIALVLLPGICFAQTPATTEPASPPPPLVPAPPSDAPVATQPATPPPPGAQVAPTPPPPGYVPPPGQANPYYSPYGQPPEKPGPEIGLMISESLFGMLTSAAATLLPYFLILQPSQWGNFGGGTGGAEVPTLITVLTIVVFSATPLAVSQTELGLANGSRYYQAESWPPALAGLLTQGAVLGIFAATGGFRDSVRFGNGAPGLLVGSVVAVPLAEMVAINFFKFPKGAVGAFGGINYSEKGGLTASVPKPMPLVGQTRAGLAVGVNFPVLSGAF